MNFFFQIQSLQLLIFCMDDQEFVANLDYALLCFFYNIIKVNHFLYKFIILLHLISSFSLTRSLHVPYAYISVESIDCILLSSFEPKAILLISSIKTLCPSLLNLCCVFNINLLLLLNSSWSSLSISFYFYLDNLFYYQAELLLNSFYNFKIQVFFLWHTFLCLLLFCLDCCHLLSNYKFLLLIQQIL